MKQLHVQEKGSGHPLLLIHGFPMTSAVWNDLSARLAAQFRVVTVDLPGFGKSPLPDHPFSISDIADTILAYVEDAGLKNSVVIGHSLGGYVTLAMVEKQPAWLAGFGLLHSTAYPDSAEKKDSRTKTIEFIEKNGAEAFTSNFVSPLFANPAHAAIGGIREMNMQASAPVIKAYTRAMRDRPDRSHVYEKFSGPVLFIAGAKDAGIPAATVREQARKAPQASLHVLDDQAHMALVEAPETVAALIGDFMNTCFPKKQG